MGEAVCPVPVALLGDSLGLGAGAGAAAGGAAGASAASAAGREGATSPSAPITATAAPTADRVAFLGQDLGEHAAAGDGTSESTLSVEISKSGSSRSTASPTALNQRMMMPSVIDSPSEGRMTSANVEPPAGQGEHGLAEGL